MSWSNLNTILSIIHRRMPETTAIYRCTQLLPSQLTGLLTGNPTHLPKPKIAHPDFGSSPWSVQLQGGFVWWDHRPINLVSNVFLPSYSIFRYLLLVLVEVESDEHWDEVPKRSQSNFPSFPSDNHGLNRTMQGIAWQRKPQRDVKEPLGQSSNMWPNI